MINENINIKFDKNKLGQIIGQGIEQYVYDGGDGYVYKVYGEDIQNSTLLDMVETYKLRNISEINLPVSYEGYIENDKGKQLPVFKQKKITIPKDQKIMDMLNERCILLGYKLTKDVLYNDNYGIFDIHPGNLGIDNDLIYIIDGLVVPRNLETGLFDENLPAICKSLKKSIKHINIFGNVLKCKNNYVDSN